MVRAAWSVWGPAAGRQPCHLYRKHRPPEREARHPAEGLQSARDAKQTVSAFPHQHGDPRAGSPQHSTLLCVFIICQMAKEEPDCVLHNLLSQELGAFLQGSRGHAEA